MYVNNIQEGGQAEQIKQLVEIIEKLAVVANPKATSAAASTPESQLKDIVQGPLLPSAAHFSKGGIPTPPEAGELQSHGMGNILNPLWCQQIEMAKKRNGGFGSDAEGYLAWGQGGFFRFKNDTISPDLCRRYAQISIESGIPIEKLKITNKYNEHDQAGKIEFADKFETRFQAFLQDPSQGFSVKAGRERYKAYVDPKSGASVLYTYKAKGGFGKILGNIGKFIKPIATVLSYVPGFNYIGMALKAIVAAGGYFDAKGKQAEVKGLLSAVGQGK